MTIQQIISSVVESNLDSKKVIYGYNGNKISVYPRSLRMFENELYFIGKEQNKKYLYILTEENRAFKNPEFKGTSVPKGVFGFNLKAMRIEMNHDSAILIKQIFPFTNPVVIGKVDSFGFGDRLGIANPAHIQALEGSHMKPILAQQSIRELERTKRTADEVLDAAVWAVFQEGYTKGYGADADHLKTIDDIDRMANAGYTMFTFDPSAYVINEAAKMNERELKEYSSNLESGEFTLNEILSRYSNQSFRIDKDVTLHPSEHEILSAFVKYVGVIKHVITLYRYLKDKYKSLNSEVELSVDETDVPTSPFEHFFIANELNRQNVELVSLAPRFIGDFEKGIDYKGNIKEFVNEYKQHLSISKIYGGYKISIHSGSDKFSIYNAIGKIGSGIVHVKTAGTSYLEALRTIAAVEPELIKEILDFAREHYLQERNSYHVSADLNKVPAAQDCSNYQLLELFNDDNARQVFHVTFGKVLTAQDTNGRYIFRDRIKKCLEENEELHYENLIKHFRRHLDPFKK
ncbi:MAG: putative D-tagaturonate epimerase [Ignavibacteriae bacterium]|nr:MAG: putative D-tagaturonate epimerase [Ignavibacteriota bacterium]